MFSKEGGGVRCGSRCGVEEDVGKGVLEKSAPVSNAQGHCTITRGQMACGCAKQKVLSAPRASRTSWRRAVAYHPEDAEGVSKEYAGQQSATCTRLISRVEASRWKSCKGRIKDQTAVVTTVVVRAAVTGRSCGGKQDELLHVGGAHERGAGGRCGVRRREVK